MTEFCREAIARRLSADYVESPRGNPDLMWVARTICGVLCFGIGVAFTAGTIDTLMRDPPPWLPAFFAGVFLLGSYLLLRRK
jgi:hypothetical protein